MDLRKVCGTAGSSAYFTFYFFMKWRLSVKMVHGRIDLSHRRGSYSEKTQRMHVSQMVSYSRLFGNCYNGTSGLEQRTLSFSLALERFFRFEAHHKLALDHIHSCT